MIISTASGVSIGFFATRCFQPRIRKAAFERKFGSRYFFKKRFPIANYPFRN